MINSVIQDTPMALNKLLVQFLRQITLVTKSWEPEVGWEILYAYCWCFTKLYCIFVFALKINWGKRKYFSWIYEPLKLPSKICYLQ